ncbi:Methyltransferase-like protein 17, mitochondrial, partial [Orchesella cincta]
PLGQVLRSGQLNSQFLRSISYYRYPQCYKTGYGKGIEARVQASLDEEEEEHLKKNNLKPKDHSGRFRIPRVSLPDRFKEAVKNIASHENIKSIAENAKDLRNYLWSRRLPMENEKVREKAQKIAEELTMKDDVLLPFLSEEEAAKLQQRRDSIILNRLHYSVYHWEPIRYTRLKGLEYIIARSSGEYAALCRIFNEISKRDAEFKPKTLCDFGSGVGTVSWAARSYWSSSLVEHLCADVSWEMNELAELIFRGGNKNNDHSIPALFFRQHLPESYKIRYDLVVSAFSLMELPSAKDRLQTIDKLWNKTEQYLVVVEPGTKAGFRAIIEARDYILGLGSDSKRPRNCFVFSPCPHNKECPKFAFDTIPCNFEVKSRPIYPFHEDRSINDSFCYVVIRRGLNPDQGKWPRLVEDPLIRSGHVVCRLCTKDAKISEVVLTKAKHSLSMRVLAKRSVCGDLLPLNLQENTKDVPIEETEDDTEQKM